MSTATQRAILAIDAAMYRARTATGNEWDQIVSDALSALGIIGTDLSLIHRTIAHAAGVET